MVDMRVNVTSDANSEMLSTLRDNAGTRIGLGGGSGPDMLDMPQTDSYKVGECWDRGTQTSVGSGVAASSST